MLILISTIVLVVLSITTMLIVRYLNNNEDGPETFQVVYRNVGGENFTGTHGYGAPTEHIYGTETILVDATKAGHQFLGWFLDVNGAGTPLLVINADVREEVTLHAKWQEDINVIGISYFDIGGEIFSGTFTAAHPNVHTLGTETILVNPTRVGHTFLGWFLNSEGMGTAVTRLEAGANFESEINLYAKWEVNNYVITFDVNGGNLLPNNNQTVTFGEAFILPEATRELHIFGGWLHNGNKIVSGIWNIASDVTLIANWIQPVFSYVSTNSNMSHNDGNFGVAIDSEGNLWSWGSNANGRTGQGTTAGNTLIPTIIDTGETRFRTIATSLEFVIAIDIEGNLWSWGNNVSGRTGLGLSSGNTLVPTMINTEGAKFDQIAIAVAHTFAIDTEGNLWSFGNSFNGRTGQGQSSQHTLVPTMIDVGLTRFTMVSVSEMYGIAIDTEGNLWSWGLNTNGRTGQGVTAGYILVPTMINTNGNKFATVSTSTAFVIAIDSEGNLWSWGLNDNGRTGQGTTTGNTHTPTMINTGSTRFEAVSVANTHALALDIEGNLWSWGNNVSGRTGLGLSAGNTLIPTMIDTGEVKFSQIAIAVAHNVVLDTEGNLWSFGNSFNARTGQGQGAQHTLVPTIIDAGLTRFNAISVSEMFGAAINTDGRLLTWGLNQDGRTGQGGTEGSALVPSLVGTWPPHSFIMTFDVQGGVALSDMTVTFGGVFILPTPIRIGYTFDGWLLEGTLITSGIWNIEEDVNLVAAWIVNSYEITFDVQGGDALSVITVIFGEDFQLPTPTREGYTFNGWLLNGNPFVSGLWSIASDVTLVAIWIPNSYEIAFDVQGGDALSDMTVIFGEDFQLPTPTRTGYTFNGWLLNGNPFVSGLWSIASDVTLVAIWIPNSYEIAFDVQGGDALSDMTVIFGEDFQLPTPTRTGFIFEGWLLEGNAITSGIWDIDSDITLVAVWMAPFVYIASANTYSIAIDNQGRLWSWGSNANGRTGLGTAEGNTLTPTMLNTGLIRFQYIALGQSFAVAIDTNGRLWSWGNNANGRTGLGTDEGNTLIPSSMVIPGAAITHAFRSVVLSNTYGIAIDEQSQMWSWGDNAQGQLGLNMPSGTISAVVTRIEGFYVSEVVLSTMFAVAIDIEGRLLAWGSNINGRTGLGLTTGHTLTPTVITGVPQFKTVVTATEHTVAIDVTGRLWSWGSNGFGQTGLGVNVGNANVPTLMPVPQDIVFENVNIIVMVGMAIDNQGRLWSWGSNANGRAGQGAVTGSILYPTIIDADARFIDLQIVAAGPLGVESYGIAIDDTGSLWVWGSNSNGAIAQGNTAGSVLVPTNIAFNAVFAKVSITNTTAFALDNQGRLWSWGSNENGRTGLGLEEGINSQIERVRWQEQTIY